MGLQKCCVGGCTATSESHRLFCFPKNDKLRSLWLSYLVPTNSLLNGLSKEQLIKKRVCEKHFDKNQFDHDGRRLRYSYPCLLTSDEVANGVPLASSDVSPTDEHNYAKFDPEKSDDTEHLIVVRNTELDISYRHDNYKSKQDAVVIEKAGASSSKQIVDDITDVSIPGIEEAPCNDDDDDVASQIIYVNSNIDSDEVVVSQTIHEDHSNAEVLSQTIQDRIPNGMEQKDFELKKFGSKNELIKQIATMSMDSLGDSTSQRLAQAQSLLLNKELFDDFFLLNQQAQTFLLMQLKQAEKKKMARRFNFDEKIMALLLMKQSPKGYKLLEKMFALPTKRTLNRLVEKVSIEPGINPKMFEHIMNKTKNWNINQKFCTIVFDEVALTPHLTLNLNKNFNHEYVDIAGEIQLKFCDHALVFMLRGICSSWRQSIAFFLSEGAVSAFALQNILDQMVTQISLTGLIPLGIICDEGSTFRTAISRFREDTVCKRTNEGVLDDGSIHIAGHNLNVFFDPPHLLKELRNNFVTKDILWNGKTASWKDIEFIYDLDSKLGHNRALPKLTANHVEPNKIKKMKVSVAAEVLSCRTAAMLKYTNALNNLHYANAESTMATTAEVIEFIDTLFDSVNGYPGGMIKGKLREPVTKNSPHHTFWNDAIEKLKDVVFVDRSSEFGIQTETRATHTLQAWITTLESFIRLSKLLFDEYGVERYYPRFINHDPLEKFFERIGAFNNRNVNPDAKTFLYAFKSLVLTNILNTHTKFANSEEDNEETLLDVGFLFESFEENNKEN